MNQNLKIELSSISDGAGIFDAATYDHLSIEGPDATSYLQRMTSNEVKRLALGEGRYSALLDRKGMVLSLFYLIRTSELRFLAIIPNSLLEKTENILLKAKFIEKVSITRGTRSLLLLIGPKAEQQLKTLFTSLPEKPNQTIVPEEGLLLWKEEIFGPPVWNISGAKEKIEEIRSKLESQATSVGDDAIRLLRMSVGFPEYGVDIDESHILLETLLPVAHQRGKGCYPGQEVIERISAYGKGRTPRTLCVLRISGEESIAPRTEIFTSTGDKAGFVTSALYNPLEEKTLVLGYLEHKYIDEDKVLKRDGDRLTLSTV